jgi:hypothetical protein
MLVDLRPTMAALLFGPGYGRCHFGIANGRFGFGKTSIEELRIMINQQKISAAIDLINEALKDDWRSRSEVLDALISDLTAREMVCVWSNDRVNHDIVPYVAAFHPDWLEEINWAERIIYPEDYEAFCIEAGRPENDDIPSSFDPDLKLGGQGTHPQ